MKWPPVLEFLEKAPELMGGAPEIWHSQQQRFFTRPELKQLENPFVLLAKVTYHPDKFAAGLEGWIPVVAATKQNEPGVLSYSIGKDVEHENRLTFVEAYENEKYLQNVHFKSKAVQQKLQEEDELRSAEPEMVLLKHVAGYWCK
jgi:quinol monooxygenase YgiN